MTGAGRADSSAGSARRARLCARLTAWPLRRTSAPAEAPESRSVPITSATCKGSLSSVTAIAAESTGDTPTITAVRDGPITPTARVNRIWLIPGANSPVTKNGQVSTQSSPEKSPFRTASTTQNIPARNVVTSEAASASIGGWSERRIVTASAPNDNAAPAASRTTKIGAAGFEPANLCVPNAAL